MTADVIEVDDFVDVRPFDMVSEGEWVREIRFHPEAGYEVFVAPVVLPLGLALEVVVDEDGGMHLGGVWDYRDDPEGITFGSIDRDKAERVAAERERHAGCRTTLFGDVVQPVDRPVTAEEVAAVNQARDEAGQ